MTRTLSPIGAPKLRHSLLLLALIALAASVTSAGAQSLPADSVTANDDPPRWGSGSCQATLPELSDGSIANPGICLLGPVDPNYTITFTFSPPNDLFMTGINIWANDGRNMGDNELRQLDVYVDYFDPETGSTETLFLDNVNIGDTLTFNDPKFVSFTGGGGGGLYRVSEVRINELVGRTATQQATFREIQGVFATLPVAPEIEVSSSTNGAVSDGGSDPQGTETAGVLQTITYTIRNTGTDTLTLGAPPSVSNATNISGAVGVTAPSSTSLAPGETTTFEVSYTPDLNGPFSFDLDIGSNDTDESVYDITVTGTANEAPTVTLVAEPAPPAGPFPVTATFSEPVTGFDLSDFVVTNGTASGFANPEPGVYTILVTPTDPGQPISVVVPAAVATDADGVPNSASDPLGFVVVNAPTPVELEAIRDIIEEETVRDLRNRIAFNQRALRDARSRHAQLMRCRNLQDDLDDLDDDPIDLEGKPGTDGCAAFRGLSVEPSFDGKITATEKNFGATGSFFTEKNNHDGTRRRLAFGEVSITRFEDGDVTASLDGRVAWERLVGEDVLRGLFIGGNATQSDIDDSFSGDRTGFGLNAGAYFVDQLDDNLFWDGFISVGVGQNNLELNNGTIDVEGDYRTTSLALGVAVSGMRAYERFELHPELSLAYGVTSVGDADLTAVAPGGTSTQTLETDNVSLGTLRFRPEFVFPGEVNRFGITRQSVSIAPSVLCETLRTDTTETDCGGGLELDWTATSDDGRRAFTAGASREVVGGDTRDQLAVRYEHRF